MVKKYFRSFIIAACTAMSMVCGNLGSFAVSAAEIPTEQQSESQEATETETETETAAETEAGTESETEVTESAPETVQEATESSAPESEATQAAASAEPQTETQTDVQTEKTEETEAKADSAEPKLSFDKTVYSKGDKATASVTGVTSGKASSVTVSAQIPDGMEFGKVVSSPSFEGADVTLQYEDSDGNWQEYSESVDTGSVKGIRYTAKRTDGSTGLLSSDGFVFTLKASGAMSGSMKVSAVYDEDGTSVEKSASADIQVLEDAVTVKMSQTPDVPTIADDIRQTVSVTYNSEADSRITYTVDPSLDVRSIEVGSNTYLEGGKAAITSDAGEEEVSVTSTMDLSGYKNIIKIVFTPKIRSYKEMEAKFTAVMALKESAAGASAEKPVTQYTCTADVWTSDGNTESTKSQSLTSKTAVASIADPSVTLTYDGKEYSGSESGTIAFGKDFELNISSMGETSYNKAGSYECSVTVPSFVTMKEVKVPSMDGASKVTVYASKGSDEVKLGETEPGGTIAVNKSGYTSVRFVVSSESGTFSTSAAGHIAFSNDLKENKDGKTQNASFRAVAKTMVGEAEYTGSSAIVTANIKNYKRTESDVQPQTNKKTETENTGDNTSGGNTSGGNSETEAPQTESETENPYDAERKKAETERKEQVKKEALQNESKLKGIQKTLLAQRLSSIQSSALSSGSGSTSTSTKKEKETETKEDKYADWTVKPIYDDIIKDLIPKELMPISEKIISDVVPAAPAETAVPEEAAETVVTEETVEETAE